MGENFNRRKIGEIIDEKINKKINERLLFIKFHEL